MHGQKRRLTLETVAEFLRLLLCLFQGDHDIAEHPHELVHGRLFALPRVVEQREGQHVGRAVDVPEFPIQFADSLVVGKGDRHLNRVFVLFIVQSCFHRAANQHFQLVAQRQQFLSVFKINLAKHFPFHIIRFPFRVFRFCALRGIAPPPFRGRSFPSVSSRGHTARMPE